MLTPMIPEGARVLFLKAKLKGDDRTLDLFDQPAEHTGALVDKEVQHKGYTDKEGHYHAPFQQRHKVRMDAVPQKPQAKAPEEPQEKQPAVGEAKQAAPKAQGAQAAAPPAQADEAGTEFPHKPPLGWNATGIKKMGMVPASYAKPAQWRKNPADITAATAAAAFYARRDMKPYAVIPGNSYMSRVYQVQPLSGDPARVLGMRHPVSVVVVGPAGSTWSMKLEPQLEEKPQAKSPVAVFVVAPDGSSDFGAVPALESVLSPGKTYPARPVRLEQGQAEEFGHSHIVQARRAAFREAGYRDELEALADVGHRYTHVYEQPNGRLLLVKRNGQAKFAAVELQPTAGGYYGVTTWFLEDAQPRGKPYETRGGRKLLWSAAQTVPTGEGTPFPVVADQTGAATADARESEEETADMDTRAGAAQLDETARASTSGNHSLAQPEHRAGDTKTENGVTYVLRGGRWHRMTPEAEEKQATKPVRKMTDLTDTEYQEIKDDARYLQDIVHSVQALPGVDKTVALRLATKLGKSARDTLLMAKWNIDRDTAHTIHNQLDSSQVRSLRAVDMEGYEQVFPGLGEIIEGAKSASTPSGIDKQIAGTSQTEAKSKPGAPMSAESAFPSDIDPSSPNYRYRDTGYVAGSRKEEAASLLRQAKRGRQRVRATAVDWDELERNPREAKEVITKSHLFGAVDWDALKAGGMEPGAGFLVDRVYAAVGTAPKDDTAQARKDYALGLESLRDRLEGCKTPDQVAKVLDDLRTEWDGAMLNAEETREYAALTMENHRILQPQLEYEKEHRRLHDVVYVAQELASRLEAVKARTPEQEADLLAAKEQVRRAAVAVAVHQDANPQFQEKRRDLGGGWTSYDSDVQWQSRQIRQARAEVVARSKARNARENPLHRAWSQLGDRFVAVLGYRDSKGSETFRKQVATAKAGRITDWSWAEKAGKAVAEPKGASEESTRFQLLVADKYERKGGRAVAVDSTEALKQAFGLRDVQSGNWVLRDLNSAKFHVEHTAEAFADLADLIGAGDRQVAMNGRLALAFGARGRGNAGFGGAARAHYESVQRIINLTKMGGGGSLAHEWFHAFDNLLMESLGTAAGKDTYLTEDPMQLPPGELRDAFIALRAALTDGPHYLAHEVLYTAADVRAAKANIDRETAYGMPQAAVLIRQAKDVHAATQAVDAYYAGLLAKYPHKRKSYVANQKDWRRLAAAYYGANPAGGVITVESGPAMSSFRHEAAKLDQGQFGKYWSQPNELAARAFQAWCEDRLRGQGRRNDYLSVKADNRHYRLDQKPFPEGEERARINAAFDRLMQVVAREDLLAKALGGRPIWLIKARGWWGPGQGGTHVKRMAHEEGKDLGGGKAERSDFAPDPQQADAYRRQLDKALKSRQTNVDVLRLGDTPAVMLALGVPEHPVTMSRDIARKAINGVKHHVSLETIERLPELLADPVMVFDSASEPNAKVAVIDATDANQAQVIVAVHVSAHEKRHVVNRIASVYGKDRADQVAVWVKQGLLRYRHTQKSLEWFQSRGLQLPKEGTAQGSGARILTDSDVVKLRRDGRDSTDPARSARVGLISDQPDARLSNGPPAKLDKSIAHVLFFKARPKRRKRKVCMDADEFQREHERLVEVLRSPGHTDDLREARKQVNEVRDGH